MASETLRCEELTPQHWPAIEELFGPNGACAGMGRRLERSGKPAGKRLPASFAYTGPLHLFEEQGFEVVQRLSPVRPLVRRELSPHG
jgi:hypothetical protein